MNNDQILAQTQAACMFALSSDDVRCAALRNLLLHPPPSDGADNKEKFAAALQAAISAMPAGASPPPRPTTPTLPPKSQE